MAGKDLRVGSVFVDYKSNDAQFQAAAKRSRTAINKLRREMRPLVQTAKRLALAFTGVAAASAYASRRVAQQIDQMAKFSRAMRGTIKDMQILNRAAGLQGIEFQKLQVSLKKLDVVLGQISDQTAYKLITDQWDKLGLAIEDVINLPLEQRVKVILDAINQYVPAAERAATASALFGSRNAAMILQLGGGGALQRAAREVEDYGGALTEAQKIGVEGFNDAVDELQHAVQTFSWQLVARHAPAMRRWAERMAEGLKEGGRLREILERVARAAEFSVKLFTNLIDVLDRWINETTQSIAVMAGLALAFSKIAKMIIAFRNALAASGVVIAAMTAGLGGIITLLASLGLGVVGTQAVLKTLNEEADDHNVTLSKMNDNYNALIETLDRAKGSLKGVWEETVRATQANLDQMEIDLERRAAEMGRSDEYQKILEGIAQAEKEEAQARRDLAGAQADGSIGFGMPSALAAQRRDAVDAQRRAALQRIEEAKARKASFESDLSARKAEIDREEKELADIRAGIQKRIAQQTERAPATAEERTFDVSGRDTQWGPIGLRPGAGRDLDVSNKDTVWGPIGLRRADGGQGPDHARAAQLRRRFEDSSPLVQTGTFEKLRALHREYAEIRKEITALGPTYAHLQTMADQSFQAAKRHAMGITFVREEMVMLADSVKDRMRGVVDAAVDDFFDGTKKIGDSWRRLMRQLVKDAIWMRARSALSTVGNTIFGGIGSTLFHVTKQIWFSTATMLT